MKTEEFCNLLFYPVGTGKALDSNTARMIYLRNKTFTTVLLAALIVSLFFRQFVTSIPIQIHNIAVIISTGLLAALLLTCRRFPGFFGFCYAIVASMYGPLCLYYGEGFYFGFGAVFIVPPLVHILGEKWLYTIPCVVVHIIFLHRYVGPELIEMLATQSSQHIMNSFVKTGTFFCSIMKRILVK